MDQYCPKPDPSGRYRGPCEGAGVDRAAMQACLDREGLVEQLRRDATHGFFVI
jgi:hypothetical protein